MRKTFYIEEEKSRDVFFNIVLFLVILTLFFMGKYFYNSKYKPQKRKVIVAEFNATLSSFEKKSKPKPKILKKKKVKKIIKKPKLAEKKVIPKIDPSKVVQQKNKPKKIRKVYGIKRVFAKGIGSNGSMEDAIISKKGNTLNKDVDTLKATKEELKGKIVSVGNITLAPKLKKMVKPKYTKEMLKNSVEGVIRAKVLIDVDGKVKKVRVLNDLGYGSKAEVIKASRLLLFTPAKINKEAVAVWIIIKFPFRLIDS